MSLCFVSQRFFQQFLSGAAGSLALLMVIAHPAFADTPPIGYTGVMPYTPPVGYTGIVPHTPPIGYIGVAPHPAKQKTTPEEREKETLISATRMNFDQNTNIATASGNVEIAHAGYVLHADKVTFNQNTDVMHAEGHIAMLHPDGEVSFADEEDVTGDMKNAYIKNLGVLFPDNSRLKALNGQRYDGRYMVGDKGVYTACNVCKDNPDNPPLWQLKADEVVHDNVTHDIYYHDMTIDFAGVPVAYSPYFSGPDPTVDRRQGFLSPMPGYTSNAGYFIHTPYYFDIAPDKDAIFAPTFSTNDIMMLGGEYRERFDNGKMTIGGNVAYADLLSENTGADKGDRLRGDLTGDFLFNLDNVWRAGSSIDYVSDKSFLNATMLARPPGPLTVLISKDFEVRDYASINSYYFQDLQPGTQPVQPVVMPNANFSLYGEPGATLGGRWSLDGGFLVTSRDNSSVLPLNDQGPQTRRLSLDGGWERRLVSDTGLLTTINAMARADGYWADGVPDTSGDGQVYNHVLLGRGFGQANITESYPLARHGDGYQQILEPIVMLTAAPAVHTAFDQPIEDSLNVQFDETNLFASNRFTGDDLIEGGSRITYGVRQSFIADGGAHFDVFGGQSYDFSRDNEFPQLSGLSDHASDYVGHISASPGSWLDADYSFRFSHKDLSPEAQDAHISFGVPLFRPSLRYVLAYQTDTLGNVDTVEELIPGFSSTFAKYWTLTASEIQAFQPDPGPRQTTVELSYTDECFIFGVSAQRNDTNRFDIKPGTSVLFHIMLKNVGGIRPDSFNTPHYNDQFRQTE